VTVSAAYAVAEIERLLGAEEHAFYRLPGVEITESVTVRAALDGFRTYEVPAGDDAAAWLRERALREHRTSRTVLALGRGRICGYYALASSVVTMNEQQREAAGIPGDRDRVPATLLAWIARNPDTQVTGSDLLADAVATCLEVNELQATAVLVLDAHDEPTAEMWLGRPFGLRRLRQGGSRLWLPLTAAEA
jgi:hypothetical protein